MAGQAGWYPAPGEAGQVRYWNGTAWTEHRQPMPSAATAETPAEPAVVEVPAVEVVPVIEVPVAAAPPLGSPAPATPAVADALPAAEVADTPVAMPPVVEPTRELSATELAMIEFERQFEKQAAEEFAHVNAQPAEALVESPVAPTVPSAAPVAVAVPAPSRFAPPSTVADMWNQVAADEDAAVAAPTPTSEPAQSASPSTASALLLAPAPTLYAPTPELDEGWKPARAPETGKGKKAKKRMSGGARTIIVGIFVLIVSGGVIGYLAYQALPQPGEASASAVVTDLGASQSSAGAATCAPTARFAVTANSYTASTSVPVASCPVALGQQVEVIYDVNAPATSGRIQVPGPFAQLVWLLPLTGLIVFIVGVIAFMRSRSKAAPIS